MISVQQLSQEVGIGVDTLRIWEKRYGFPVPGRDSRGHRSYSSQQVEELRIVKKLQSLGHRPGKIFALSAARRRDLLTDLTGPELPSSQALRHLITGMTPHQIDRELRGQLQRLGLAAFIRQVAMPLIQLLDRGWTEGSIRIAREHLISDRLEQLFREQLSGSQQAESGTRILFLTLSGERHKLGLLMAAAVFHTLGTGCILLNEELPLSEIPQLASELQVAAVALSFSAYYSPRQAKKDLASLRNQLDHKVTLIAGGEAVKRGVQMPNLIICSKLEQIPAISHKHFPDQPRGDQYGSE